MLRSDNARSGVREKKNMKEWAILNSGGVARPFQGVWRRTPASDAAARGMRIHPTIWRKLA